MARNSLISNILSQIAKQPGSTVLNSQTENYVSYNVLSILRPGRKAAISNEFKRAAVYGCQGTRERQFPNTPIAQSFIGKHREIAAGYPVGGNKHTGVSLNFNVNQYHNKHLSNTNKKRNTDRCQRHERLMKANEERKEGRKNGSTNERETERKERNQAIKHARTKERANDIDTARKKESQTERMIGMIQQREMEATKEQRKERMR